MHPADPRSRRARTSGIVTLPTGARARIDVWPSVRVGYWQASVTSLDTDAHMLTPLCDSRNDALDAAFSLAEARAGNLTLQ